MKYPVGTLVIVKNPILLNQQKHIGKILQVSHIIKDIFTEGTFICQSGRLWFDNEVEFLNNPTQLDRLIYDIKDDV